MKIPFFKKTKKTFRKEKRFDPHHFWVWYIAVFIMAITAELVIFSGYFLRTTHTLDAPVVPTLATNAVKIKSMQKSIEKIDTALKQRTGEKNTPQPALPQKPPSQNQSPVVQ